MKLVGLLKMDQKKAQEKFKSLLPEGWEEEAAGSPTPMRAGLLHGFVDSRLCKEQELEQEQ